MSFGHSVLLCLLIGYFRSKASTNSAFVVDDIVNTCRE